MKKFNYLILGATALALASCSQDELIAPSAGDGNTSFRISLPGMVTRSLGDGSVSLDLQYAVYEAETDASGEPALGKMVFDGTGNFTEEDPYNTTVNMNLASGKSYYVAFFANSSNNNVYTFNTTDNQLEVNYDAMTSANNLADAYDCFYQIYPTGKITGTSSFNVTLYRPVAQVNWGTNDLIPANKELQNTFGATGQWIQTNLSVTVPNTMDFLTKAVSGEKEITLKAFAAPKDEVFPVGAAGDYQYVAVQYLLAPQDQAVYDLKLNINNDGNPEITSSTNDIVVDNAPVQANYRTNIYGALLSNNVEFNVTKGPWDGMYDSPYEKGDEIYEGLYQNGKIYTIASVEGLANFIEHIAPASGQGLSGYTVILATDLDMKGIKHTPFNNAGATFDGQGHTISNLSVNVTGEESAGFMSSAIGTVQNLNFEDAAIVGNFKAGVLAGDGLCARINNVTVKNSTVTSTPWMKGSAYDDGNNVGGIVGYLSAEPNASITNCTVSGSTIRGYRDLGGITGTINGKPGVIVSNNTIENSTIICDLTYNYKDFASATNVGEIYGRNLTTYTVPTSNVAENVSILTVTPTGFSVDSPGALFALANLTTAEYQGKTITLESDIDMKGVDITPIIFWSPERPVTFDGKGHTIYNIELSGTTTSLFGNGSSGCTMTIQNLNVDGISGNVTGRFCGLVSNLYGNLINVHVSNVNIKSAEGRVGAIVGLYNGGNATNCSVKNANLLGGWCVGGMFGGINETNNRTFTECSVENITVKLTGSFGPSYTNYLGAMTGDIAATGCNFVDCTITNCGEYTLPIVFADKAYTWNGEEKEAGLQK